MVLPLAQHGYIEAVHEGGKHNTVVMGVIMPSRDGNDHVLRRQWLTVQYPLVEIPKQGHRFVPLDCFTIYISTDNP